MFLSQDVQVRVDYPSEQGENRRLAGGKPRFDNAVLAEKTPKLHVQDLHALECVSKMPEAHLAGNSVAVTASLPAFLR